MPRIAGVDIPEKKKIRYALRYIHGIGAKFADDILNEAGVDLDTKADSLTDQEVSQIAAIIDGGYIVEGALRRLLVDRHGQLLDERHELGDLGGVDPATPLRHDQYVAELGTLV